MTWIKDLKAQCNIIQIARQYVKVEKINANKALIKCPFHPDSTPSCHLNAENNMFYCFGCNAYGDVIKFVEKIENISFTDAVHKIANIYNFEIPKYKKNGDKYFDTMKDICLWAHKQLLSNPSVMQYLNERKLSRQTIIDFSIGYMDNKFQDFCKKSNISERDLDNVGLDRKILYLMQDRIIFPIFRNGNPIGLAGRTLSSDIKGPKYINIRETKYFKKKKTMYWHPRFEFRRSTKEVYLVEGYTDVCLCEQNNLSASASMGTSCSHAHIINLWQYTDRITVLFDGDMPGQKAASKLASEIYEHITPGKEIMFGNLPYNTDPAEFLSKNPHEDIEKLTLVEKTWRDINPKSYTSLEHKVAAYRKILSMTNKIQDKDLRYLYKREFANMWHDNKKSPVITYQSKMDIKNLQEFILIGIALHFPNVLDDVYDYFICIRTDDSELKYIQQYLIDVFENKKTMLDSMLERVPFHLLQKNAPFIKQGLSHNEIIKIWFDIFDFYTKKVPNYR